MTYAKASKNMLKSLEELVPLGPENPWKQVEDELKSSLMGDPENLKVIAQMADGVIVSMVIAQAALDIENKGNGKSQDEIAKESSMVMMDVVSTVLLRAFALGVHCQKSVSEVELLESLVGAE